MGRPCPRIALERLLGPLGLPLAGRLHHVEQAANIRNEICSMTVSGLVMPPVQNSVQSLSMSLFCWRRDHDVLMMASPWRLGSKAFDDGEESSTSRGVGEEAVELSAWRVVNGGS